MRVYRQPCASTGRQPCASTGAAALSPVGRRSGGGGARAVVDPLLRAPGQPLAAGVRADLELRFGHDFSQVRVHADTGAAASADAVDALAYTVGSHIVFGAGQYRPESPSGRHLLAHELAHTLQQGGASSGDGAGLEIEPAGGAADREAERAADAVMAPGRAGPVAAVAAAAGGARLQRKCAPAKKPFDLAGSAIGARIRAGLQTIVRPGPDDTFVPRVDPGKVLAALASSNCFLADAEAAAARAPDLTFTFHEDPERGTFFRGGVGKTPPTVTLEVTDLGEVVRRIVHEVVHASHRPGAPPGPPAKGSITRVEEASIAEEKNTRDREIEILDEINAALLGADAGAGILPAKLVAPYTGTGAEAVRADFRSGSPKLTYQEFAIIEAKKEENRVAALVEDEVTALARRLLTGKAARTDTADDFDLTSKEIKRYRSIGAEKPPPEPLTYLAAKECVSRFYGLFTSPKGLPDGGAASPACVEFMEFARAAGLSAPIPGDRLLDVWKEFVARRNIRAEAIETGSGVARFLDRVDPKDQARAIEFLEWTMIAEAMAKEWQPLDRSDPKIRGLHLDLLAKRLGAALAGISRPAPGP